MCVCLSLYSGYYFNMNWAGIDQALMEARSIA